MSISVVELLAEIGADNIGIQFLSQVLDGTQRLVDKGRGVRISFVTEVANFNLADLAQDRLPKREAILCWVDRVEMERAVDRLKGLAGLPRPSEESQ